MTDFNNDVVKPAYDAAMKYARECGKHHRKLYANPSAECISLGPRPRKPSAVNISAPEFLEFCRDRYLTFTDKTMFDIPIVVHNAATIPGERISYVD